MRKMFTHSVGGYTITKITDRNQVFTTEEIERIKKDFRDTSFIISFAGEEQLFIPGMLDLQRNEATYYGAPQVFSSGTANIQVAKVNLTTGQPMLTKVSSPARMYTHRYKINCPEVGYNLYILIDVASAATLPPQSEVHWRSAMVNAIPAKHPIIYFQSGNGTMKPAVARFEESGSLTVEALKEPTTFPLDDIILSNSLVEEDVVVG